MNLILSLWLLIVTVGLVAAAIDFFDAIFFVGYLRRSRPELVKSYRLEIARVAVVLAIQTINFAIGVLAATKVASPLMVVGLLSVPLLLALLSLGNGWVRHRGAS